ncbi:CGGC domain-containing protein [Desulfonema magnum]|uniref:CGGC domain-containing protein n=2 Tax=Desulfonema magnum TaxID=45655 RepID=A0A975BV46_9BACT|nr:CGGC domain-containing protein [Desulfonema magnum]QTA92326.1 CGGC domain-containing protein [Desulfonema magnum]
MSGIGIIRCEKNMNRCPLTGCLRCLTERKEGFVGYEDTEITGFFTCQCPGDDVVNLAKILKSKGAEAIHFCTCLFAKKGENGWDMAEGGFCDKLETIIEKVHQETQLPCVKGTAHLPKGYEPLVWK